MSGILLANKCDPKKLTLKFLNEKVPAGLNTKYKNIWWWI